MNASDSPPDLAVRFAHGEGARHAVAIGLALMLLAAGLFVLIARQLATQSGIAALDAPLSAWCHARVHGGWTPFMLFITTWHRPAGVLVMAALFGAWLHARRLHYWLLALLLSVPGGMLLNVLIKYIFHRVRPHFDDPLLTLTSYSFPSGHTSGATFFYGLLAAFIVCSSRQWSVRAVAVIGAVFMVALVALSRVYLGAHYLSDVLAAIAEGCAWLALCITAVSLLHRHRSASLHTRRTV